MDWADSGGAGPYSRDVLPEILTAFLDWLDWRERSERTPKSRIGRKHEASQKLG
jgi:hypothetical protein